MDERIGESAFEILDISDEPIIRIEENA